MASRSIVENLGNALTLDRLPGLGRCDGSIPVAESRTCRGFGQQISFDTVIAAVETILGVGTQQLRVDAAPTINYNAATATVSINVSYSTGSCLGDLGHSILQPINADGSSTFKQRSTVPAKFRVCDAAGHSIGTAGVVTSFNLVQTISGTVSATVDDTVTSTTLDSSFRWDSAGTTMDPQRKHETPLCTDDLRLLDWVE